MSEQGSDSTNDGATDDGATNDGASNDGASQGDIGDEQLPEDLQPGEDNPLAEPLDPEDEATKSREELEMGATQEDLDATRQAAEADEAAGTDEF